MTRTLAAPAYDRLRASGPGWRRCILPLALIPLTLGIGTACTSPAKQPPQAQATRDRPRSTATVSIVEPAHGAELSGLEVRVRVALTGGEVVYQTTTGLTPNEGHIHLTLDGKLVSMLSGLDQTLRVTPGLHLLEAEFVATDHLRFEPRVLTTVTFTVK
jgi:hypothetical protein